MKYALPISLLGHAIIFSSGMFAWNVAPREPVEEIINVRLEGLELGELNNIKEVIKPDIIEEEVPEEPDVTEGEDEPEPLIAEQASPEPQTDDIVEDIAPDFDDEPVEEQAAEPDDTKEEPPEDTPVETPVTQNRNTPSEPSIDDLFSDLDESLNQDVRNNNARKSGSNKKKQLEDQEQTAPRRSAGEGTGSTATLLVLLKAQITEQKCWRSVSDLPDWERLDVTIRFQLDSMGRISKAPERIRPKFIPPTDKFMFVAADRAIRAINLCAPFDLPEAQYSLWQNQDIELTFDEQF